MAFISKQLLPISLQGGLAQKQDPYQVQPPNLLQLENAQFNKIGQLNKRPGYQILSNQVLTGNNIASASAIDSFNGELNLFDNLSLYSYSPSAQAWSNRGPAISLINTVNQIIRNPAAQQLNPDCASFNNVDIFVWEDSRGGCRYSVLDHQTGTYLVADQLLNASFNGGQKPKAIVFQGLIYLFYTNQAVLYYQTINPQVPNVISLPNPVIADGNSNFSYDCWVLSNQILIAYYALNSGAPALKWFTFSTGGVVSNVTTVATGAQATNGQDQTVSILLDSHNTLWVSWSTGIDVRVIGYQGTSASIIFPETVVETVVCPLLVSIEYPVNSGQLQLVYEVFNSNPSDELVKTGTCNVNTGVVSPLGSLRSVGIASKPYSYNGNNFINLAFQSPLQSTYFGAFLSYQPFTIISKVSPQDAGGLRSNGMAAEVNQISPGMFLWANLTQGRFIFEDNTSFALLGVQSTLSDFTNINKFNSTVFSNNLLFVGGITQSYDGVSASEQNFHIYPEGVTATQSTTAFGQLTTGAQYQYQVIYAWTDRFGQIQYSTPSPTLTVQLTGGNNTITLTLPTLRLTAKQGVIVQIYRTLANGGDSANPVFYVTTSLLTPPDPITGLGGGGILNNPNIDTLSFTDLAADTAIAANQPIYTQGGVLPNTSPPSCSMISLFQDRVILGGLEDPYSLWFSKTKSNNSNFNTIPVEFSADNVLSVSQIGGKITAFGLMDQNLLIFKQSAIFILTGEGPNNEGGGNSFGDAQLITQQVGCINPNSIILFGQGIAFQTPDKGIWMIDRNLSGPQYLGAGVDDIALHHLVSSATLDPNSNSIIFTTFDGPTMVYDYLLGQWSTFTNHQAVDSCAFQSQFTMVKSNGLVYQQEPGLFYDGYVSGAEVPYSMSITTPWISFGNLLGYQRIFRIFLLGTYKGPHTLNVGIGYNFDNSFTQVGAINTALTAGANLWGSDPTWGLSTPWGGAWQPYIYQVNPAIQQCSSFRLQISDSQTAPYNEGYALSSLLLELGVVGDGVRTPVSNKIKVGGK